MSCKIYKFGNKSKYIVKKNIDLSWLSWLYRPTNLWFSCPHNNCQMGRIMDYNRIIEITLFCYFANYTSFELFFLSHKISHLEVKYKKLIRQKNKNYIISPPMNIFSAIKETIIYKLKWAFYNGWKNKVVAKKYR